MLFKDWTKQILKEELDKKPDIETIIETIRGASNGKSVFFYPCSKYTRQILKEIKRRDPNLFEEIGGCFDKSDHATSEPGVEVYRLDQLDELVDEISMLVIASSNYYARQLNDIHEQTSYSGPILKTSFFDYSMPKDSIENLLSEIEQISDMLYDKKSQMTYLVCWMARILNDEDITNLFESENEMPDFHGDTCNYKGYTIMGVSDAELKKELFANIYKMKYVGPEKGDVVFDIGAFKGETAIVFADSVGETGKVYAFEPINASYKAMVRNIYANRLEGIIEPVNMGCSNEVQTTAAVSTESGAPWTFISDEDGAVQVELTTVDEFVHSNNIKKLDFIKIDVESFERDVLLGAKEVLRTHHPKLAIALYHKSSDLITIPRLIKEIADYKLFVRCNIEGPFGINLFCV